MKQRDIMIALTQRLNERDEQIMALQVRSTVVQRPFSRGSPSRIITNFGFLETNMGILEGFLKLCADSTQLT